MGSRVGGRAAGVAQGRGDARRDAGARLSDIAAMGNAGDNARRVERRSVGFAASPGPTDARCADEQLSWGGTEGDSPPPRPSRNIWPGRRRSRSDRPYAQVVGTLSPSARRAPGRAEVPICCRPYSPGLALMSWHFPPDGHLTSNFHASRAGSGAVNGAPKTGQPPEHVMPALLGPSLCARHFMVDFIERANDGGRQLSALFLNALRRRRVPSLLSPPSPPSRTPQSPKRGIATGNLGSFRGLSGAERCLDTRFNMPAGPPDLKTRVEENERHRKPKT